MSLENKVVWITGASRGIGEALAKECSRKGAFVVLSARGEKELYRVQASLTNPEKSFVLPFDICDTSCLEEKTKQVLKNAGKIDMLINNAGIDARDWVKNTELSTYKKVMDINFFGNIALTLKVLPHLSTKGHIVSISSVNGLLSDKKSSAYAASKHALMGFYNALRAEISPQQTVSVVTPGYIKTDITLHALKGNGQEYGEKFGGTLTGMDVNKMAKKVVSALERRKTQIYVGGFQERLAVAVHAVFPRLFFKVIEKVEPA
ncbi:MAG: hypothetical protein C4K58_07295 [Flavobacteriaceae bacterium]|nr:MAG: hypothetical protein C4K58_07295 [Flavobacteriaceae bacterium]